MDIICYRKDPLTTAPNEEMIDVLECYPKLKRQAMREQSLWIKSKYDTYDHDNDDDAVQFLLNSLQPELTKRIKTKMRDATDPVLDTFVDVLFILIDHQRPHSADLFESITNRIRKVHSRNFPGENITMMAEKIRSDIIRMEKARSWDSKNNIHLCRTLSEAGGEINPEYRTPLYNLLEKVQDEVSELNHLSTKTKRIICPIRILAGEIS